MNDNIFGRIMALALIVGAVYGANAIARGKFGCGVGAGSCCMMAVPAGDGKAEPAKFDPDNGAGEDEAKIEAKAPVAPPK
jgi:hypothetical protein